MTVYSNIAYHGNTSSASVPIALDECIKKGVVSEGDLVLLDSFGGAMWGGALSHFSRSGSRRGRFRSW